MPFARRRSQRRRSLRRRSVGSAAALLLMLGLSACSTSAGTESQVVPQVTGNAASAGPQASAGTSPTSPTPTASPTPAVSNAQIIARSTVPVLCYHQISTPTSSDGAYAASITISPKLFTEQLTALRKAGYHSISPQQLRAHLLTGAALPAKPVLLTFDDGTRPQWTVAGPILAKEGFIATFFPMTVVLNKDGWLRDSDLRAMHAAGMTIGSHTWDHQDVREYTKKDWKVQLGGSLHTLSSVIGAPVTTFAYPYGAWNDKALAPVAAHGVELAFQLTDKPISETAPLLTQRRLLMTSSMSGRELLDLISERFPQG